MSRELSAAIVVDAPTFERCGPGAADLVDQGELPIRGRSEPARVYALPLQAG
jgi:class 3 adenylate cyclase